MSETLLRLPEVMRRVGLKKTAVYARITAGAFPKPVVEGNVSRWFESEIDAYIEGLRVRRNDALSETNAAPEAPEISKSMGLALACAAFNEDTFGNGIEFPEIGEREVLAIAAFFLTHEHHGAILQLFLAGREGSALAMLRPCFETMARGVWLLRGATDEQLEFFCNGRDSKKVEGLLKDLSKGPSALDDAFLSETWVKSERSLHQFTHTSYQLLVRRAPEEELPVSKDPEEVGDAVRFASGTALLATIELARMANLPNVERQASKLLSAWYPTGT